MSTKEIIGYIVTVIIFGALFTGCVLSFSDYDKKMRNDENSYYKEVLRRRAAGDTTIVIHNGKADTTITIHK